MRMLSRVISGLYDEVLAQLQLKGSQLNVLATLAHRGPAAPTDLCAVLQMDKSTLSRNLERMGKRGWLAVRPGEDNRTHVVELTAKGTKLLQDAYPRVWKKPGEILGTAAWEEPGMLLTLSCCSLVAPPLFGRLQEGERSHAPLLLVASRQ